MMTQNIRIRPLIEDDIPDLMYLIRQLADYENLTDELSLTRETLRQAYFGEHVVAHALLAFKDDNAIGYASYFFNFSTFKARTGLYLEDLFVLRPYRNMGVGQQLFYEIIAIATERKCGWIEGLVLDWNTNALKFYKEIGAEPHREWVQHILPADRFPHREG